MLYLLYLQIIRVHGLCCTLTVLLSIPLQYPTLSLFLSNSRSLSRSLALSFSLSPSPSLLLSLLSSPLPLTLLLSSTTPHRRHCYRGASARSNLLAQAQILFSWRSLFSCPGKENSRQNSSTRSMRLLLLLTERGKEEEEEQRPHLKPQK